MSFITSRGSRANQRADKRKQYAEFRLKTNKNLPNRSRWIVKSSDFQAGI
jgi:hypothetical protein